MPMGQTWKSALSMVSLSSSFLTKEVLKLRLKAYTWNDIFIIYLLLLLFFCSGTPKKPHSETKTVHSPATRHSPRSTLELHPSVFSAEVNFSTHHCGISHVQNRLPVKSEHERTYSLPMTPSRESYIL